MKEAELVSTLKNLEQGTDNQRADTTLGVLSSAFRFQRPPREISNCDHRTGKKLPRKMITLNSQVFLRILQTEDIASHMKMSFLK